MTHPTPSQAAVEAAKTPRTKQLIERYWNGGYVHANFGSESIKLLQELEVEIATLREERDEAKALLSNFEITVVNTRAIKDRAVADCRKAESDRDNLRAKLVKPCAAPATTSVRPSSLTVPSTRAASNAAPTSDPESAANPIQTFLNAQRPMTADEAELLNAFVAQEIAPANAETATPRTKHFFSEAVPNADDAQAFCETLEKELTAALAERDEEKSRRIYYQQIVYDVCCALDKANGKSATHGGIVCGTVKTPSRETQDALAKMIAERDAWRAKAEGEAQ